MPKRKCEPITGGGESIRRTYGSLRSKSVTIESTSAASSTSEVRVVMQSSVRQAGTRPRELQRPRVGFQPTRLLNAAGTRPEPAVSEPSAKGTTPAATRTADPELEPPLMYSRLYTQPGLPYG